MAEPQFRLRRSCLYMPGSNSRALEKAKTIDADVLIFDLEDAVAPDEKCAARELVCAAVKEGAYGGREIVVRMNALDSEWGRADLEAIVQAKPDALLAPKIVSAEDVAALDHAIGAADGAADLALWVMIEMPLALLNMKEIAQMRTKTRLRGFVMGTNDLAKECRAQMTPDRAAFQMALSTTIAAARAFDLVALDGVYNEIKDEAGFLAECRQGMVLGFDGKTLIHPTQVAPCNDVFAPTAEEIAQAQSIIAAFSSPENQGKGVIKVAGRMTELLHLEQAKRLVAVAEAISSKE